MTPDAADFSERQAAGLARSLPLRDSVVYLRGMLLVCHGLKQEDALRGAYIQAMSTCDSLDVISGEQMLLPLPATPGDSKNGKRKS